MKHGILLVESALGFTQKQVITKNGRYSVFEFLNSNFYKEEYKFVELNLVDVADHINEYSDLFTVDDFLDAHYWLTRGNVNTQEFQESFQKMWMIAKEVNCCQKCEVKCE